jgi:restriction system protein
VRAAKLRRLEQEQERRAEQQARLYVERRDEVGRQAADQRRRNQEHAVAVQTGATLSRINLLALTPAQFEHLTAELFRRQGYQHVHVVGRAGDYGVDITGVDPAGYNVVIQCKRYAPTNKIGSPEVQTFLGMAIAHHGAQRAIFVTTSTFTAPARNVGARSGVLQLVDGWQLARMLVQAGLTAPPPTHSTLRPSRTTTSARGTLVGATLIVIVVVVLFAIGEIVAHHTASEAKAAGCIPADQIPSDYLNNINAPDNCPDGYLPSRGCIVTTNSDGANGTGGCSYGTKPWTFTASGS